jgi:hypothetical protein
MKRVAIGSFGLILSISVALSISSSPAGATTTTAPTGSPQIVATPNDVMVNTQITLTGSGFPPHMRLRIAECSSTGWMVVAQKPCDNANKIWVHTHAHGNFSSPFTAELCPRTSTGPDPVTQETCYVGVPEPSGIDTISLVGAAQVIVTYP